MNDYRADPTINFELRQLRQFLAIAEERGFRAAAERLNITQPALSVSLRKLEDALGVRLFVRHPRGVELTPEGRALLPQLQRTVAHAEHGMREARQLARGEFGIVRIGFVGSAVYRLLPIALPTFRAAYPDVQLDLIEGTSATFLPKLQSGELDIALIRKPISDTRGLRMVDMERDRLVAVLPRNHPLAEQKVLDLASLAREPFVTFSRAQVPGLYHSVQSACLAAGFQPYVAQEVTQATTLLGLVGSGLGVALTPSVIGEIAGNKVVFIPLKEDTTRLPLILTMVTLKEAGSPAVELLWSHFSGLAADPSRQ